MLRLVLDFRLAGRNLRRSTSRSFVASLSVAGGVIAFVLAGGFVTWIFQELRESTIHSQLGHIQIVRPGYFDKGVADPYAFLLPARSSEQAVIEQTAGVVSLTPRLAFTGLASHGDVTIAFIGEGVDPVRERPISSRITIMSGRDLVDASEPALLLGEGLAASLGARAGDTIVLLATASSGSPNAVEVKVVGTFSTLYKDFDERALRLPIVLARKLMRVEGSTSWVVSLDRTESTAEAVGLLSSRLPPGDFEVIPWSALADFYNKTVVLFSKQVNVVRVIIGLIIILTISNTLMMSVLERTREIGTCLAIGQRRALVMRMFLAEGVLIGFLGGVSGIAAGYLLAAVISYIGIPMPPPPGMARGYNGQILVDLPLVIDAFSLALFTTLIASVMPAWKASRMNIVDALRYNQ
ncbi:MAG: ABC transporter permease [Candidatus Accumulibacter sp.]|uniref:ABC transporter permease n=1 Tax=Candidatus Accumulibacter affinis TaxID=2954384 RepID=A0A935TL22_9PROT|nr:ABC transporter permease [Candidatus Accumulibacter affinis]